MPASNSPPTGAASAARSRVGGRSAVGTILLAGFVGGLGDILYAFVAWGLRGVSPVRVLQGVAAGWLGRDAAVAGGIPAAMLGLASHFFICFVAAALFYRAAKHWRLLVDRPWFSGAVFGCLMYVAMVYVVVPLSAAPGGTPGLRWSQLIALAPHVLLVGIPFALITRRALRPG